MNALVKASAWYTVLTKPRSEEIALEHLQRQEFECFLPKAANPQRLIRPKRPSEPLFPRYLFLKAQAGTQNLSAAGNTRGVASLVRFGHRLATIPTQIIESMRSITCRETGLMDLEPLRVNAGDSVTVFKGPLAGLKGIVQARTSEERVIVLMSLLGREQTMELDLRNLRRA